MDSLSLKISLLSLGGPFFLKTLKDAEETLWQKQCSYFVLSLTIVVLGTQMNFDMIVFLNGLASSRLLLSYLHVSFGFEAFL